MESNLPISVHYSYFALPFSDQNSSSEEESGTKRRRRSHEFDESNAFWTDNFATLPDSMTRVPKTDALKYQQHVKMLELIHHGKAHLVASRAELDLVKLQLRNLETEANRLRTERLEYQMRSQMLERQIRGSPVANNPVANNPVTPKTPRSPVGNPDDTNVGASTSKGMDVKQEYPIPDGFDRNESIFNHMADTTFQRLDSAIVSAKKGQEPPPPPLMSLKVTPPKQDDKRPGDKSKTSENDKPLGNYWNVTGSGPFVLHTHAKPRMDNAGANAVGRVDRGDFVALSQGVDRPFRAGNPYGRGYGNAGPSRFGLGQVGAAAVTATGFTRAGIGHGAMSRAPAMGMSGVGRGIGFKISPPKPRLPMPVPIRLSNFFGDMEPPMTTTPATSTTMTATGSSSSAVAGSTSSSGKSNTIKPKRTRPTVTKSAANDNAEETKVQDVDSDSDQSVLRIDTSERDEAFINERDEMELTDYEDAY